MSYAIIRNEKYKSENLKGIYRHNERRNKNYSNKNIDKERSYLNYSIKSPTYTYEKEFERIRKEYNLKGQIKTVSNIACEYIITSDNAFFESIGEKETKRYFETAYKFVCEYKDLGEQYIMSAKVHLDEDTPHLHLVFIPVVHTTDKKGNNIDKIACSEFWKEKDSYRRLQDAFYGYMVSNGFNLERGTPKEQTGREHYDLKDFKLMTNFEDTKKKLENMKLELPKVPELKNMKKVMIGRDDKILNDIIKPKDELIEKLHRSNVALQKELSKQANVIDIAEKYQKERNTILADNEEMHNKVKHLEYEYKKKSNNLDFDYMNRKDELEKEYQDKSFDLESKYKSKIHKLEKENSKLHKIIDKFYETIERFIHWVCKRFGVPEEDELIRDFQKETRTFIDPETQLKHEAKEKEWNLEL